MFPIGDQIDPEVPTDPNELVLYRKYGRNWREIISGRRYTRDRGGNLDRGMRFMHTTPEGFMTRPTSPQSMSQQQMMQSDIDQSGYMAGMQKLQDDYNRMLQEWYSLTGSSEYQEQQDYYAQNYENIYGGGSGSQDSQYTAPAPVPDVPTTPAPVLIPKNGFTGTTATQPNVILPHAQQTTAAYKQMAQNNAAPAPTLSQFITRYDRDNQDGKIKTVAPVTAAKKPVTTVVKPATSFRKY